MTMTVTRTAVRLYGYLIAVAFAVVVGRGVAGAAQMCISMANSGGAVAGMQVDISWDQSCAEATAGKGTSAGCAANPANGKQASSRLMGSTMRVLLFATDNVDPIPDGELFCCAFSAPTNPCCSLQLSKLIASDPGGQRLTDPNLTFTATMDGNACAQLGVAGAGSSGTSPARGNLAPRQQQAPAVAQGGNTDAGVPAPGAAPAPAQPPAQQPGQQPAQQAAQQPAAAAPQQQAKAQPQAGGPGGGPIGVPPPTAPQEMAQVPAAQVPQAGQPPAGAVEAPAAAGVAGQAQPPAGATATAAVVAQAAPATPAAAAATSTKAQPTATKTLPPPTATPTAKGGFLSGCNLK